jgi:hypothetical protein
MPLRAIPPIPDVHFTSKRHRCSGSISDLTGDRGSGLPILPSGLTYSSAIPFSANSFFAFSFLAKCIRPMPRSTLGAFVNWILS